MLDRLGMAHSGTNGAEASGSADLKLTHYPNRCYAMRDTLSAPIVRRLVDALQVFVLDVERQRREAMLEPASAARLLRAARELTVVIRNESPPAAGPHVT
jgi:hypothetical protein